MAKISTVFSDYNSTTPMCQEVLDAISSWGTTVGNLSSAHQFGQRVHQIYDDAVDVIKGHLHATDYALFTCSCATEANNWLFNSLLANVSGRPRVIISAIEHPSVASPLSVFASQGVIDLQICRVDAQGILDLDHLARLLTPDTLLVSVMLANNDIGTIQPLARVCQLAKGVGAMVHSDIVQAAGKIPIDLDALGLDAVSLSGHKCYAPTGCGVLMVKDESCLSPFLYGGSQQQQLRAGTVNVLGLHLFSVGLSYCYEQLPSHVDVHSWAMALCDRHSFLDVVVPLQSVLWNTVSLSVRGHLAHDVMMRLDMMGVAVSTGSACSTGAVDVSSTIQALNLNRDRATSVIRLSFGYPTTPHDFEYISQAFVDF